MLWSCKARHNAFHFALSNPDSQSILEFVCPTFYPRITLRSASFHSSADVLGNRVVLLADMLPAMLQCEPKSWRQMFYTTNGFLQWAWSQMVVEPVPSSPASEKTVCSNMIQNFRCREYHRTNARGFLRNRNISALLNFHPSHRTFKFM